MADSDRVRYRKPISRKSAFSESEAEIESSTGGSVCNRIIFVSFLTVLILGSYLCYAFATSPICSVAVSDLHDVGRLKWAKVNNKNLQRGRKLLLELKGPESIVVDKYGNWYTGLEDGRIVKVANGAEETQAVVDLTESIDIATGNERMETRPHGLRLINSKLYFADTYQGIFMIDVETKNWKKIVGYNDVSPPLMFTNDLTITADEKTIYFTDTSARWDSHGAPYSILEGECSGRLFKVDTATKRVALIRDGLCFANGIELDHNETKLLVSENSRRRILVIDIKSGDVMKKILLPGGPDNIRRSMDGGYWIPIPVLPGSAFDFILPFPAIRDVIAGVISREAMFTLLNLKQGVIVKLDANFNATAIHYDLDGKVAQAISQVTELDTGELLLGTVVASGIVKLDLGSVV